MVAEESSKSSGGGNDGAFTYKSRKVVWRVDPSNEGLAQLFSLIQFIPLYCICVYSDYKIDKYYGLSATTYLGMIFGNLQKGATNSSISFIEECECNCAINTQIGIINCNGSLIDFFKEFTKITNPDDNVSDEEIINLLYSMGLTQTSYDSYLNQGVGKEYGCLTLKN